MSPENDPELEPRDDEDLPAIAARLVIDTFVARTSRETIDHEVRPFCPAIEPGRSHWTAGQELVDPGSSRIHSDPSLNGTPFARFTVDDRCTSHSSGIHQ